MSPRLPAPSLLAVFGLVAVACAPASEPPGQPAGWDEGMKLPIAKNVSATAGVVELDLEAHVENVSIVPGGPTPMWTYNGQLPGPMIRARVGDRVVTHFKNNLAEDTTIHWHGLRVPAAMDGMPGHSQPPIAPGGTFDYSFVVPDASTFWYHPHVNSAVQSGNGLYGPFIVDDPSEPAGLGDEVVIVLSDIGLDDDGSLQPDNSGGNVGTLFGREGNVLLVNGKVRPTMKARPGLRQRWRFINAAKTRYFQIALAGHSFTRIGGDGGLLTAPVPVDQPVLALAERADLLVVPDGEPGQELVVKWIAFDRGYGSTFDRPPVDLFAVQLEGSRVPTPPMPVIQRTIEPLSTDGATAIDLTLTYQSDPFSLGINGVPYSDTTEPLMANVGETQVWTVSNTFEFAHPFHLHGFFFQVLDPPGPLEWKDTVNVPPTDGVVKFVVRYDDRPGMWMFHCHILDHAEAGMMGSLMVMEPGTTHQH